MRPDCGVIGVSMAQKASAALNADTKPRTGRLRYIRLVPFGWHTRYLLQSYARHVVIVSLGLLVVALAIDLTPNLVPILESRPEASDLSAAGLVGHYIILRTGDILAKNLPLSIYLGILWCEFAHTHSNERIAVDVSGRSPLQCLVPAIIIGVSFGLVQLTLDLWLRPAAVMTQAAEKLGKTFGDQFLEPSAGYIHWIKLGTDLISARIDYGPPPALRDVTLYRLRANGQPHQVVVARSAAPGQLSSVWKFKDGFFWEWTDALPLAGGASNQKVHTEPSATLFFNEREIKIDLDQVWLTNLGIDAKYLPQATVEYLASSANLMFPKSDYQTWYWVRLARGLFVLGMVLLAASLGQISRNRLPPVYGLLFMVLAGYFGHVAGKAFEIMGEQGSIPPIVAGWTVPIMLVLVALAVQLKVNRQCS